MGFVWDLSGSYLGFIWDLSGWEGKTGNDLGMTWDWSGIGMGYVWDGVLPWLLAEVAVLPIMDKKGGTNWWNLGNKVNGCAYG